MAKPPRKKLEKYVQKIQKKIGGHTIKIADSNFFFRSLGETLRKLVSVSPRAVLKTHFGIDK